MSVYFLLALKRLLFINDWQRLFIFASDLDVALEGSSFLSPAFFLASLYCQCYPPGTSGKCCADCF